MSKPVKIGVIGCGAISGAYFGMAKNFPNVEIFAAADLNPEAAKARAAEFNVPHVMTVDELLKQPDIEIVLNLTVPKAHVPVALAAMENGKHVYCEKPLAVDREEGRKLLAVAKAKGLRVGCAPDTFMGQGIQVARKAIDDGMIGRPVGLTADMLSGGHEGWHKSPEFYYEVGGGPMFDMGPYYLTALLNLLGPVKRITGIATIAINPRTITSEPKRGKVIQVETPDHVTGLLEFENGAVGPIQQSFATKFASNDNKNPIVIMGTEGALRVPDPNGFDGTVYFRGNASPDPKVWTEVPVAENTVVKGYGRSVGLADMAAALRGNRPHRCSLEQAFTVLDLMQGFLDSSSAGRVVTPSTPYTRPAPMPFLPFGQLD
jgi:predicted dehydrogenase